MAVKLLSEQYLELLSLKGGCTGLSESIHVKMQHCWKSHVAAQLRRFLLKLIAHFEIRHIVVVVVVVVV